MADMFHHEALYRGPENVARLAEVPLTLCGAGAVGSLLIDNLARQGVGPWKVIDRDRVEEDNAGTQLFGESDVGAWKAEVLRNRLFRAVGVEIEAVAKELTGRNARGLLKGAGLVIDAFDNQASRRLVQDQCREQGVPCLHAGLFADYAEVVWDENYRVPRDGPGDVCDYPLARNLVMMAVALASEVVIRYLLDGARSDWSVTLRDFAIRPLELPPGPMQPLERREPAPHLDRVFAEDERAGHDPIRPGGPDQRDTLTADASIDLDLGREPAPVDDRAGLTDLLGGARIHRGPLDTDLRAEDRHLIQVVPVRLDPFQALVDAEGDADELPPLLDGPDDPGRVVHGIQAEDEAVRPGIRERPDP
jgi:molybdopterin-synthase adenylyltransferase